MIPGLTTSPAEPLEGTAERQVTRNFLALGLGEVASRVIAFAATIYLARTLDAGYYGVIGFATAVVLYLSRVADGGMELGVGISEVAARPGRLQAVAPTMLTVRLLISILLSGALVLVGLLAFPQPEGTVLALYGLTLIAVGLSSRWIYLGLERTTLVAAVRTGGETLMVVLVLLLVSGPKDLARVPLAQFAGDMVAALLLLGWLVVGGLSLRPRIDLGVVRRLLPRAAPMVGASLLGLMIYNSDLIFLRVFHGTAAVGYYAAAYALISFMCNVGIAYALSLLPTLTRLAPTPQLQQRLYQSSTAQVFAAALPVAVGGTLLAPAIIALVFGERYLTSGPVLQVLVWAIPVSVLRDLAIAALMSAGREGRILKLTTAAAALNIVLNLILIPRFALLGAAIATVATETLRLVAAFALAHADGFPVLKLRRLWKVGLAVIGMTALLLGLRPSSLWAAITVGLLGYAFTLALTGAIRLRRNGVELNV